MSKEPVTQEEAASEKLGCAKCGSQHYHAPLCPHWVYSFSEPSPVLDSERAEHAGEASESPAVPAVEAGRVCQTCKPRQDCNPDCQFCTDLHKQGIDCVHRGEQPSRICVRGVDGSEGCGHEERVFLVAVGHCGYFLTRGGYAGNVCGHRCEFSSVPPEGETHAFIARTDISTVNPVCAFVTGVNICCGQPRSAPVHKVESEDVQSGKAHKFTQRTIDASDTCMARVPPFTGLAFCGQPRRAAIHQIPAAPEAEDDWQSMALGILTNSERRIASPQVAQGHEPPARVWLRLWDAEYSLTPKYDNDDIEYAHLAPIQEALAECETCLSADPVEWYTCWKALVTLIKGDK